MKTITYRIVIWGTGRYGKRAVKYSEEINRTFSTGLFEIICFIDSNKEKQGGEYCGKKTHAPEIVDTLTYDALIVAVKDWDCIKQFLDLRKVGNYFSFSQFVVDEILTIKFLWHQLNVTKETSLDKFLSCIKKEFQANNNNIVRRLCVKGVFSKVVDHYDKDLTYRLIEETFGCGYTVAGLYYHFGEDIESAKKYVGETKSINMKKHQPATIGLYYPRYYCGGIERVISQLMPRFIEMGYKVVFFTEVALDVDAEYSIPDEVYRYNILSESKDNYNWILSFWTLINETKIDVFCSHTHSQNNNYYLSLLTKYLGIRFIIESHTSHQGISQDNLLKYQRIYSCADELIVLSNSDVIFWEERGIICKYIPNPVENKIVDYVDYKNNSVLWIGRIDSEQKNVLDVVDILYGIKQVIPMVKLMLVGAADDNKLLVELQNKIIEMGVSDNIELCGYHTDVENYYQSADVMIMTSSFEGFPMTVAESKLYGLPLVLYELPYLELLKEKKGYVSVPQRDINSMVDQVVKILKNRGLRDKLSLEARESIKPFIDTDISGKWKSVFEGAD